MKNYLVILLVGLAFCVLAQEASLEYLSENGFSGKYTYTYTTLKKDTTWNGKFELVAAKGDVNNTVEQIQLYGNYLNQLKHQKWVYDYRSLSPSKQTIIEDNLIVNKGSGEALQINAFFNHGKANGEWKVSKNEIINGKITRNLFTTQANFNASIFTKQFNLTNQEIAIDGQFNDQGIIDGKWTFTFLNSLVNLEEIRWYDNGLLKKHVFLHQKDTFELKHVGVDRSIDEGEENWANLVLNEENLKILSLSVVSIEKEAQKINNQFKNDLLSATQISNKLLYTYLKSFTQHQNTLIWEIVDKANPIEFPKFKLRKFPYNDKELKFLQKAQKEAQLLQIKIEDLINDPQLEISKLAYQDLNLYAKQLSICKQYNEKILDLTIELLKPAFEYIDRTEIYPYLAPELTTITELSYNFKDSLYTDKVSWDTHFDQHNFNAENIYEYVKFLAQKFSEIDKGIMLTLELYQEESKLREKEELLVSLRDSIYDIFSLENPAKNFNNYHLTVATEVIQHTAEKFKNYAESPLEIKLYEIESITACFKEFVNLYPFLILVEKRIQRIEELYTRTIWNPYTFTDMDEIVKSRLYEAYSTILLPELKLQLQKNILCGQLNTVTANFDVVYQKMVSLREEDTKEIERNLRRVNDPKIVAQVLQLQIYLSE